MIRARNAAFLILAAAICLQPRGVASASPLSQVGKACWKQMANGNAASAVDVAEAGLNAETNVGKGVESFESGMNTWQQDGASYEACMEMLEGASKLGDTALGGVEAGATAVSLVSQGAGWTGCAQASGGVLSFTGPLALASLAGMGIAACIEGISHLDAKHSLKCMEDEHARLNDDGLDCKSFDRKIARKKTTLNNLPAGADARKTIEDEIRDLEKRKADCKRNRESIRDALSVGDCAGPGMHSDFMIMRCESIRALFCSNDPRWERRRNRLKATFPEWGIEYVHCGTPIAQPTPTAAMEEQYYLY